MTTRSVQTFPSLSDIPLQGTFDYYDVLHGLLLSQDKESVTFKAFCAALGEMDNHLLYAIRDLLTSGSLDGASGWLLDRWGEVVGEKREGLKDDDYRRFIKAAVILNKSFASVEDHIALWGTLMGVDTGEAHVEYTELYPHGASFTAYRKALLPEKVARRAARMMRRSRPMGVVFRLVEAVDGRYFGFVDHASHPHAAPMGFNRGRLARAL